ncbi:MAG: radical SAM protein [Thermoanaerobaculaceae bacterium]|nr:radical SAM protein [Thermoanaerobaculaceae bacterium]
MKDSEIKFKYIYGPVPSRRLGKSLGVDLLPFKICSYDCIYCQLGKTKEKTILRKEYVPTSEVLKEIKRKISEKCEMDFITFAGSGEPTLHKNLKELILGIKEMTKTPVAVLTNGSLFYLKEVSDALINADVVIPSLDAGSKKSFLKVNRPSPSVDFDKMCEGLINFSKIFKGSFLLEIMIVKGLNDSEEEIEKISSLANQMKIEKIQLNTVVRPPAELFAKPVSEEELNGLKKYFNAKVEIIGSVEKIIEASLSLPGKDLENRIVELTKRRPVTLEDISAGLSVKIAEAAKAVTNLLNKKEIKEQIKESKSYYIGNSKE